MARYKLTQGGFSLVLILLIVAIVGVLGVSTVAIIGKNNAKQSIDPQTDTTQAVPKLDTQALKKVDFDLDGIVNTQDTDDDNDGIEDEQDTDDDNDGIDDTDDTDDDNDGTDDTDDTDEPETEESED